MGLFDWIAEALGFNAPSVIEIVFICCAVFGSLFFMIMMVMMLLGDIIGGVMDTAFDADVSMDSTPDESFEMPNADFEMLEGSTVVNYADLCRTYAEENVRICNLAGNSLILP